MHITLQAKKTTDFCNIRNELWKKIKDKNILEKYFNIKKYKRNLENSSSHFKSHRENTECQYKRVKYFSEVAACLIATKTHSKDELKNLMESFPGKNNGF